MCIYVFAPDLPLFVAVQHIKLEILNRDVADFHLHRISFYMSGNVQKWHWHLQNIFITFKSWGSNMT